MKGDRNANVDHPDGYACRGRAPAVSDPHRKVQTLPVQPDPGHLRQDRKRSVQVRARRRGLRPASAAGFRIPGPRALRRADRSGQRPLPGEHPGVGAHDGHRRNLEPAGNHGERGDSPPGTVARPDREPGAGHHPWADARRNRHDADRGGQPGPAGVHGQGERRGLRRTGEDRPGGHQREHQGHRRRKRLHQGHRPEGGSGGDQPGPGRCGRAGEDGQGRGSTTGEGPAHGRGRCGIGSRNRRG